jgi:hypothetical protein
VNPSTELTLWYGDVLVGHVRDAFCSDATWHGNFDIQLLPDDDEQAPRLIDFIDFCEKWDERLTGDPSNPPDAAEFDRFSDLLTSGLWFVTNAAGETCQIDEAPVFFAGGEVSWRTVGPT